LKALDTVDALVTHARRVLREGPAAVRAAGVEALIVDQMDIAAATVADRHRLPFVTVCCAPPLSFDARVPPPYVGWRPSTGLLARIRNRAAHVLVSCFAQPVLKLVNERRRAWGLVRYAHVTDALSRRAVIAQLPACLDFNGRLLTPHIVHAGPFREGPALRGYRFPWQRLNGKPLVYASMGTIRNGDVRVFQAIVDACARFDVQLVLSLGGGPVRAGDLRRVGPDVIVVPYAPQSDVLALAVLTINCAGLNTTLDSLRRGVPLVVIPVAEDQPGVAARIRHARAGVVVPARRVSVERIERAIRTVFEDSAYRRAALACQREIEKTSGADTAAALIEAALGTTSAENAAVTH
jgi:UDP:flavonoid glycosyltransferase YjiC (YdhE family)